MNTAKTTPSPFTGSFTSTCRYCGQLESEPQHPVARRFGVLIWCDKCSRPGRAQVSHKGEDISSRTPEQLEDIRLSYALVNSNLSLSVREELLRVIVERAELRKKVREYEEAP